MVGNEIYSDALNAPDDWTGALLN